MNARTPIARCTGERAYGARRGRAARSGFSLIELLVVMGVVVMLTALMMPSMHQLRENAQRVVCMSNMQQMGHAFFIFAADHNDNLPRSDTLQRGETPQNLMIARHEGQGDQWDGIGRLYGLQYCDASQCFYCPSHHGDHPADRYIDQWRDIETTTPIYTNYHYAGHMEWNKESRRRSLTQGNTLVLLTDGLRTATDFNHVMGMNSLRGDGSVFWRDDTDDIYKILPRTADDQPDPEYLDLWDLVQQEK